MKKIMMFILFSVLCLAGCASNADKEEPKEEKKEQTLKVASLIPPMTDILEIAKPLMKEEGINLEIVVLNDNVQPNNALQNKEVDANFFQHVPYMEQYNQNSNADLVAVQPIYHAVYGGYSPKYKSLEDLPDGATVAIANDPTNISRSLALMDKYGLIKLKDGATSTTATEADIAENKHNFEIKKVDLLMLARVYEDTDLTIMTPAYAEPLGLKPNKDALLTEGVESAFAITLVAREDNADSEAIKLLAEKMTGPEVKKFLEEDYKDSALPAF
ncbi:MULTISPECIES: MetQ/NlpA family ABC transporter substrate-binding protein [Bacillaceae]|uniref:MetQ/NlpA family ABC transporter substrate-binding protein n=1 Tax=Bacillaceae TaxID=186817 RepID=UPI001E415C48|nr:MULTISPECIES: MetQ/NlpA family ABC transporter substrate-binding protein [Bacillaceae]MCE4049983.1 MetQ/NlpA family ABC transporter substrate-binding protein [Bacillus sp. Au-Bac7]MCM3032770.1 MetQ/NlpA family ABC transporter substrate-binding protein [Niallia sp. MER 6]MDL0436880.1 MetQ/NlpA family ABC transporter substrate-binding protein [Niallia sp. SS-2023]UPO88047.1 MetQ/NlpA family ABC transporter substrate-binding protein [Niallia sp. Man26]